MSNLKHFLVVVVSSFVSIITLAGPIDPETRPSVNWCKWPEIHKDNIAKAKGNKFDIIFIGDSHTSGWVNLGTLPYAELFADYNILNLGISGDKTQHVLYRIKNGELTNQQDAKVAMLMIGANNLFSKNNTPDTPETTLAGVKEIVSELSKQLPKAKIILVANTPNNEHGEGNYDEVRKFNKLLKEYAQTNNRIIYLDIFELYLKDGKLNKDFFYEDQMHMRSDGYEIWGNAAKVVIDQNK